MKRLLILFLLAAPLRAQQGYKFDVETYGGAVCDGVRDDTAAVQKTIDAAAAVVKANGSPGPIYFPPSAHPCKVNTITFPSVNKGWLYSLFDNGLLANHIVIGSFNSFQGRSSTWQTGTLFPYGAKASWVQQQYATRQFVGDFVDLNGASNVTFKNIGIDIGYSPGIAVHIHGWCVQIKFEESGVGGRFVVERGGFNLRIIDSTLLSRYAVALSISDYGYVTVRGGYLQSAAIIESPETPFMDGYIFDDLLSENLNNQDWLTLKGGPHGISNVSLSNIRMADSVGKVYLVNNQALHSSITIRNSGWNDGLTLVDPASVPSGLSGVIESIGARATFEQAKAAFQWGQFTSTQGPTIFYGNGTFLKYIGAPMQVKP